jgi:hypothetical protein
MAHDFLSGRLSGLAACRPSMPAIARQPPDKRGPPAQLRSARAARGAHTRHARVHTHLEHGPHVQPLVDGLSRKAQRGDDLGPLIENGTMGSGYLHPVSERPIISAGVPHAKHEE